MVAGIPLLPTLPALDWDPRQVAGEGIGERGDGVPVLLEGGRELVNSLDTQTTYFGSLEPQSKLEKSQCNPQMADNAEVISTSSRDILTG